MWELQFWKNVLERALKSAAQAAVLALGAGAANLLEVDWTTLGGAAGGGFLLSVLTSMGSEALPFGNPGTASLTKAVEPSSAPTDVVGKHATDE